jgi:hypothetical protein
MPHDQTFVTDVEDRFDRDFNFLPLDVVNRIAEHTLHEHVLLPSGGAALDTEWYPMWGTLFETRSSWRSDWIEKHVDELYEIGIGVIESFDSFNAMLFIAGAGYNFYDHHWAPFYHLLLDR